LESYTTTYAAPAYYTEALSTTLCPATTPKLQLITSPMLLSTTPNRTNTTLPRATQLQRRRTSITQQILTTQRVLLRTTLHRKTMTQFYYS
jgi:hypothetical protein